MGDLHAELFCDPFSVAGWRYRSLLKHVAYSYPALSWTIRPIVAFPTPLADETAETYARDAQAAADAAGLPVETESLTDGVPASWAVCEALVAARAADRAGAMELYHRLNAATFGGGSPPSTTAEIIAIVDGIAGLDADAIRDAIGSRRATAALGRDLAIGNDLLARLDEHDVRGTPGRLRLDARLVGDGVSAPAPHLSEEVSEAADTETEEPTNEAGNEAAAEQDDAAVPAPPLVRIHADSYDVVITPERGYQEFADVLGRYDPDMGRDTWKEKRYGRKVIQAYGMKQRTAENLSGENYPEKAETVLEAVGESFVADVATCTTLDADTCRLALRQLGADGIAERGPSGGWRLVSNRED